MMPIGHKFDFLKDEFERETEKTAAKVRAKILEKRRIESVESQDENVDLTEMFLWIERYMKIVHENAPKQSAFVIEEISELTSELMDLVKELTKKERRKGSDQRIFEEACDVIASIIMMFARDGYDLNAVVPYITSKYERAVKRFYENIEL